MSKHGNGTIARALRVAFGVALVAGMSYSASIRAADVTGNLSASSTVVNNCTVSTAPVAFGDYDPVSANDATARDATGTVTVTCTSGAAATVKLGQGANADPGSTDAAPLRRLTDGTNFLSYQLYSDAGRTTVWGNDGATDVDHTGTGAAVDLTVYGRIAAGQNTVPAGSYTDTVLVTVSF